METIIFGFIYIRPGLMAPSGLYLCSRSYRNLAGKLQEKFKENRLSISSTWQTNHKCVTDQVLSGTETEGQNACCMCPHKRLPSVLETQSPVTAEILCLTTPRDEVGDQICLSSPSLLCTEMVRGSLQSMKLAQTKGQSNT